MLKYSTFTTVKSAHPLGCLTSGKNIWNLLRDGRHYLNSKGFVFLRLAVRAKLWFMRSLGQVNSVLDKCKPHGQEFVFDGGTFSFVSFFVTVLTRLFFPLFSFE